MFLMIKTTKLLKKTHDAEKALALFGQFQDQFKAISPPYNALIKALGSRTDVFFVFVFF